MLPLTKEMLKHIFKNKKQEEKSNKEENNIENNMENILFTDFETTHDFLEDEFNKNFEKEENNNEEKEENNNEEKEENNNEEKEENNNEEKEENNNEEDCFNIKEFKIIEEKEEIKEEEKKNLSYLELVLITIYLKMRFTINQMSIIYFIFKIFTKNLLFYSNFKEILNIYNKQEKINNYYFCTNCKYIQKCKKKKKKICEKCGKEITKQQFYYNSLVNFIKYLLNYELEEILYYKKNKFDNTEFLNSNTFKELKQNKFPIENEKDLNLVFSYNTDGITPSLNKKISVYPFFINIKNVNPFINCKKKFNHLIALSTKLHNQKINFNIINYLIFKEFESFEKGIIISGFKVKCYLINLIMDLPARASVLCNTQHNGKFSCISCEIEGKIIKKGNKKAKLIFPIQNTIEIKKRKRDTILLNIEEKKCGFKGIKCPFFNLQYFNIVDNISLDFMHNICLGFSKNIFEKIKIKGSYFKTKKFKRKIIIEYIKKLELPINYGKKLYNFVGTNALETLLLILYATPIFYLVSEEFYLFLNLLRKILKNLIKENISKLQFDKLKNRINKFLDLYVKYFGEESQTQNIHQFSHISDTVFNFGSVLFNNLFKFESLNKEINRSIFNNSNFEQSVILNYSTKIKIEQENNEYLNIIKDFIKKLKNENKIKIKRFYLKNGNFIKILNDDNIYEILSINYYKKNILGKNILNEEKFEFEFELIENQIIKSYKLHNIDNKGKIRPEVVFFKEMNINPLL
jgi:hypothetical protein